jgi:hypothetical protein
MRIRSYVILNTTTLNKEHKGCNLQKAEQRLNELKATDKNNEYKIISHWHNI